MDFENLKPLPAEAPTPRPLTDQEKEALREKNGGFATAKDLAKLERKFQPGTPSRGAIEASKAKHPSNRRSRRAGNGYTS